jgi:hypothetical protein
MAGTSSSRCASLRRTRTSRSSGRSGPTQEHRGPSGNRSQRFRLSPAGREARLNYRQVIVASRAEAGRKSFDVARTEWAARLGLEPTDGTASSAPTVVGSSGSCPLLPIGDLHDYWRPLDHLQHQCRG